MQYRINNLKGSIKSLIYAHPLELLVFIFLFIYLTFGLYITYFNNNITFYRYDLIYGLDTGKVYSWYYLNTSFTSSKHILSHIFLSPIISVIKGFVSDPKFTVVIVQAFIQCCTICIIYKILNQLSKNKTLAFLFSVIYGFSYTVLIFTILPEVYVWVAFSQMLLLHYVINLLLCNVDKLKFHNIFVLAFLITFCAGLNSINIISSTLLIFFWLFKKCRNKNGLVIRNFIKIFVMTCSLIFFLFTFQSFAFNHYKWSKGLMHTNFRIKTEKISNMFKGTYVEPFYALKATIMKNRPTTKINGKRCRISSFITDKVQSPIIYIPIFFFLGFPVFIYIKKYNEHKFKEYINVLLGIVVTYTIFNLFFYNHECALFALNYFSFLVIAIGLIYSNLPKIYTNWIGSLFLGYLIFRNIYYLIKIQNFVQNLSDKTHSLYLCLLYAFIITLVIGLLFKYFVKKISINTSNKTFEMRYLLGSITYLIFMIMYGIVHAFTIYQV